MKDSNQQQQPEQRSFKNRIGGFFKAGLSVAYWAAAIGTGGGLPLLTTYIGASFFVVGRIIRGIGQFTGIDSMKEYGARVADIGTKIGLSPLYMTAVGFDGIHNMITGHNKNHSVNWLNNKTNWLSGMDTVPSEEPQSKQQQVPQGNQNIQKDQDQSVAKAQEDKPVTLKNSKILEELKTVTTYEGAKIAYNKNTKSENRFVEVGRAEKDGNTVITWAPPGADKNDKSLQVTCTYDQQKNVIATGTVGDKASCIFPPMKSKNGFEMRQLKDGKSIDHSKEVFKNANVIQTQPLSLPSKANVKCSNSLNRY